MEKKMPKIKTNRGAAKRFKMTGKGRIKRRQANKRHILTKMNTKRKRHLRGNSLVAKCDEASIKQMLPHV